MKSRVKALARKFCETTTFHGFQDLLSFKHVAVQLVWGLFLVVVYITCGYFLFGSIAQYSAKPIQVSFDYQALGRLPNVTVCRRAHFTEPDGDCSAMDRENYFTGTVTTVFDVIDLLQEVKDEVQYSDFHPGPVLSPGCLLQLNGAVKAATFESQLLNFSEALPESNQKWTITQGGVTTGDMNLETRHHIYPGKRTGGYVCQTHNQIDAVPKGRKAKLQVANITLRRPMFISLDDQMVFREDQGLVPESRYILNVRFEKFIRLRHCSPEGVEEMTSEMHEMRCINHFLGRELGCCICGSDLECSVASGHCCSVDQVGDIFHIENWNKTLTECRDHVEPEQRCVETKMTLSKTVMSINPELEEIDPDYGRLEIILWNIGSSQSGCDQCTIYGNFTAL